MILSFLLIPYAMSVLKDMVLTNLPDRCNKCLFANRNLVIPLLQR